MCFGSKHSGTNYCTFSSAEAAMCRAGRATDRPGGSGHGAFRERGEYDGGRHHESAAVVASVQPAHLLRAVPVCQLPTHGHVAV